MELREGGREGDSENGREERKEGGIESEKVRGKEGGIIQCECIGR